MKSIAHSREAEEMQYAIWRKMSAAKTIKLASDFSMFLMRLSKLNNAHGLRTASRKNRQGTQHA